MIEERTRKLRVDVREGPSRGVTAKYSKHCRARERVSCLVVRDLGLPSCPSAGIGSRCDGPGWAGRVQTGYCNLVQYSAVSYHDEHFRASEARAHF